MLSEFFANCLWFELVQPDLLEHRSLRPSTKNTAFAPNPGNDVGANVDPQFGYLISPLSQSDGKIFGRQNPE